MRKVYLIVAELRMPGLDLSFQEFGRVEFAFTSKSKANEQMDKIHRAIETDELYIKEGYKVALDLVEINSKFSRRIEVIAPNGSYMLYRLQKVVLNSGCDF